MKQNLQDLHNLGNLNFTPTSWAMLEEIIEELRQLKQVFLKEWLEHPEKSWLLRRTEFIDEVLGETT